MKARKYEFIQGSFLQFPGIVTWNSKIFSKIFWDVDLGPRFFPFMNKSRAQKSHTTVPLSQCFGTTKLVCELYFLACGTLFTFHQCVELGLWQTITLPPQPLFKVSLCPSLTIRTRRVNEKLIFSNFINSGKLK